MRVAYVCADPGIPVWGSKGASAHVRAVIRALCRRGDEVVVFTPRSGGPAPEDLRGVDVVELPRISDGPAAARERWAITRNGALRAALERCGPFDLVYERYSLWSFAGIAFARSQAPMGTRALLEVNAPLIDEQAQHRALHDRDTAVRIARYVLQRAHGVVAVSEAVAAWTRGLAAAEATVLPNGVDVARGGGAARRRAPGSPFTVAFSGSLKPWHGVEILVEAVHRLSLDEGAVPTRLLVIGDGPQRARVEQLIDAAGLRDRCTLTGAIDPDEVPTWLAAADVGVAPYPVGAGTYFSPLKVVEYLGAGLPVVASAVGQIPALLDGGRAGLLTAPGDPDDLAAALRRLRDSHELRAQLGTCGRALAVARHSWDDVVARSLAVVGIDAPVLTAADGGARG